MIDEFVIITLFLYDVILGILLWELFRWILAMNKNNRAKKGLDDQFKQLERLERRGNRWVLKKSVTSH